MMAGVRGVRLDAGALRVREEALLRWWSCASVLGGSEDVDR
jgi:hypothetical protein